MKIWLTIAEASRYSGARKERVTTPHNGGSTTPRSAGPQAAKRPHKRALHYSPCHEPWAMADMTSSTDRRLPWGFCETGRHGPQIVPH